MAQQGGSASNSFGAPGGAGDQAAVAAACAAAAQQLGVGAQHCSSPNAAVGASFGSSESASKRRPPDSLQSWGTGVVGTHGQSAGCLGRSSPHSRPFPALCSLITPTTLPAVSACSPLCGLSHKLGATLQPQPPGERVSKRRRRGQARRHARRPPTHVLLPRRHCLLRGRPGGSRWRVHRGAPAGRRGAAHPPHLRRVHRQRRASWRRRRAVGAGAGGRARGPVNRACSPRRAARPAGTCRAWCHFAAAQAGKLAVGLGHADGARSAFSCTRHGTAEGSQLFLPRADAPPPYSPPRASLSSPLSLS